MTLLGPAEIRQLAAAVGVNPTKKLGQNFVHDPNTVRKIIAAADLACTPTPEHVLEIGPGLGSLTLGLLEQGHPVTAVEIDAALARQLPVTVQQYGPADAQLTLLHKDALRLTRDDFTSAYAAKAQSDVTLPTALVANLPYNVAVPVLLEVMALLPSIRKVLVMVQAEVADRLAATPGQKIYGVPSVKAGFYGHVARAGAIGRHVFWPEPNVSSGLVRIDCEARPWDQDPTAREKLWPVVDAAFAQRRKTLRAALSGHYGSAAEAETALQAAGIDPRRRGETLTVEEFATLAGIMRP